MVKAQKKGAILSIPKLSRAVIDNHIPSSIDEKAAQAFIDKAPVIIKKTVEKKSIEKVQFKVASFHVPVSILNRLDEYVATMHFKKKIKINKSEFVSKSISQFLDAEISKSIY